MAANGGTTTAGQFSQKESDIQMMLSADVHLRTKNRDYHMERYVYKRRDDGIYIFNLVQTWEKLQKAARVMAGGDQWTTAQIPDAAWPGEAEQPISAAPTVGVPLAAASDGWDTTVPPQAAVPAAGLD